MSSQSIISLPPQLEMTPRSIPLLKKHKLTETSFPVSPDTPVNVRIFLHAAKQMSSTRPRKVTQAEKFEKLEILYYIFFPRANLGDTLHLPMQCSSMMIPESCLKLKPARRGFAEVGNKGVHFRLSGLQARL